MGNRWSQTAPSGTSIYEYDENNRLISAGAVTYTHDPNGNLERTSGGQSFTFDPFNRMTQVVGAGGTATYTYNGDGLKVQRVGPDGTARYYYDGIRPVWETDGAGAMTAQLDRDIFGNLLSRREASGTRRYFHPDGLGSTVALSDEAGGVAASMLYDAWGNVRVNTGVGHGRYRFAGAELDEASGLYHMGARFYDPTIGRWLSEDPIQDRVFNPLTLNFYAYVNNDPLIFVDPDGEDTRVAVLAVGLAIPGVGEALLLAAGVVAVGYLTYEAVSFGQQILAARARTKRLKEQAFEQLPTAVEHVNKAANMDPRNRGSVMKELVAALSTIRDSVQKLGKSLDQIVEEVTRNNSRLAERMSRQLQELDRLLRELGINPDDFFKS